MMDVSHAEVSDAVRRALEEDIGTGDVTSQACIPADRTASGEFLAREAPTLAGKEVFVVGGGNSAGQAALHLARYARHVTILIRSRSLAAGMSYYLVQAVAAAPNVAVRTSTAVAGGGGGVHLERLLLRDRTTGVEETVPADALFVLIGARPLTEWLPNELARDRKGFLLTGADIAGGWPLQRPPFPERAKK